MARLLAGTGVERTDVAKNGVGQVTLTGGSDALVAANKDRVALYVSAPAADIALAFGVAAQASKGVIVRANTTEKIDGFTGAVNVIGTAAQTVAFIDL